MAGFSFAVVLGCASDYLALALDFVISRSALLPTQRAVVSSDAASDCATSVVALRSNGSLRPPTPRSAHRTPFLTKLRSSVAARSRSGRHSKKGALSAFLSWRATLASNAKAARFSNSARFLGHCSILRKAWGVRPQQRKQSVSHTAQVSESLHQSPICAGVTRAGSSTNAASKR